MAFESFSEFARQIEPILVDGFTAAAQAPDVAVNLDTTCRLLDEAEQQFPNERNTLLLYRLGITALRRDVEAAAGILDMTLTQGYFYPTFSLSFGLTSIQDEPTIQRLMKRNEQQFRNFIHNTPCDYLVMEPSHATSKPPLLLALHGNGCRVEAESEHYRFAAAKGWLVAMPESVVRVYENRRVWTDEEMVVEQVQRFYAELKQKYAFDESCVVLTGISAGGKASVDLTLTEAVPARGFIAQACSGRNFPPDRERLIPLIDASRERGIRAYVTVGDQDTNCYQETVTLSYLLKEGNLPCELEIYPGVGHEFPPNFEQCFERGLNFILQAS